MRSFGPCRSATRASGRPASAGAPGTPRPARVLLVRAVREVQTGSVHSRGNQLGQARRRAARRPDRRENLGAALLRSGHFQGSAGDPSASPLGQSDRATDLGVLALEGVPARVLGAGAELLLDAQQLVELRDAVAAGGRARS